MRNEEAVRVFQIGIECLRRQTGLIQCNNVDNNVDCYECDKCDLDQDNLRLYEAYHDAIWALKKQIPQKPIFTAENGRYHCPNCAMTTDSGIRFGQRCCDWCGQKIDWEGLKDNGR